MRSEHKTVRCFTVLLGLLLMSQAGVGSPPDTLLKKPDPYTFVGDKNFLTEYASVDENGMLNVVVEIPAGTLAKWEVMKPNGKLKWEFKAGKPPNSPKSEPSLTKPNICFESSLTKIVLALTSIGSASGLLLLTFVNQCISSKAANRGVVILGKSVPFL